MEKLYEKYDIENLPFGIIHDKLGDVYEEYCVTILSDFLLLNMAKDEAPAGSLDLDVFREILAIYGNDNFSTIQVLLLPIEFLIVKHMVCQKLIL